MKLKYPDLHPGDELELCNDGYFTNQPRYAGRTASFVRYATEEELGRGAGPYLVLLPGGNQFAALEEEISPVPSTAAAASQDILLDPLDW